MDREDIRAHQRARIIEATIECVAERGYAPTTVGHVVSRARVSRETFYELFSDKEDCYVASLSATIGAITASFDLAAADTSLPATERLERGLRSYFQALAERPAVATCFILERPSTRPLTDRDNKADPRLVTHLTEMLGTDDRFAVESYLSMIDGIVRRFVTEGRTKELPGILPQLMPVVARTLQLSA